MAPSTWFASEERRTGARDLRFYGRAAVVKIISGRFF
jgi:hypothetical protein